MSDHSEIMPGTTLVDTSGQSAIEGEVGSEVDRQQAISEAMASKELADAEKSVEETLEESKKSTEHEPDKFASKFAALSRKEKALREREAELERRLAEIESKSKEQEEKFGKYASLSERLKKEPLKVMEEEGLTYEQLTQMILNDGNPTPEMQIQMLRDEIEGKYSKEIQSLREELEAKEKSQQEAKYQEVIENFMGEITEFVNKDEQYEFIRANDAVQLVYNVIEEYHQDTGRILDVKEAADQVESYLEDQAKEFVKLKKIQGMLKPAEPEKKPEPVKSEASPTLSNAFSSQAPNKGERKLSHEESLREAAKLIKWNEE